MVKAYFPYEVTSGKKRKTRDRFKTKKNATKVAKRWRKAGRINVRVRKLR